MARHTLFTRLWRKYVRALRRRPLRTKMLTSGTLMGVSDAMAQKISGTDSIKLWRTALMAVSHSWIAFILAMHLRLCCSPLWEERAVPADYLAHLFVVGCENEALWIALGRPDWSLLA
ncbi:hypothetical protein CBR_g23796 [Chara braunii]|uniref:Uncharacterized protein n=1 Tax=Chara braunii TaxID=69332 RepID=A0A388JVL0_CHABU|nr:hypothetical protein CBR_g23796 [Chara braunii]|eukprot:GBG61841.1 hypothetical protein CBR_g23796 [Chara braunii]